MSFTQKLVSATVQLAQNSGTNQPTSFSGTSGSDTVTLSGSRCSLRVQNSGAPNGSTAQFKIYGLTLNLMDELSTLGLVFNIVPKNTITVTAGDEAAGMATVYNGTILSAYADFNAAPDVPFMIEAVAGLANATASIPPTSFPGSTSVATIMSGFARQMNIGFENNGVTTVLPPSYFPGNLQQQINRCKDAAHINADVVDGPAGPVLAIWPIGGSRNTSTIPLIAPPPAGQMIGYPSYTQQGIKVDTLFDPTLSRGQLVRVQSSLSKANGNWAVTKLDLALDSMMPRGQWMSTLYCYNPNYPLPVPTP